MKYDAVMHRYVDRVREKVCGCGKTVLLDDAAGHVVCECGMEYSTVAWLQRRNK